MFYKPIPARLYQPENMFKFFLSQYLIFYWSPEFNTALGKNPTNTITLRRTTCKEIFLPTGWRTFLYKKNPPNATQAIFRALLGNPEV
jgi:hypothetical protein